jgi:hypothetical protein
VTVKQSSEQRMADERQQLQDQAEKLKPGSERDAVLKKVRQRDVASHIDDWASSSGLRPPT